MVRCVVVLLLVALWGGCGGGESRRPPDFEFLEGFEAGLGAWQTGFELPEDPNRPGEPVAWSIEESVDEASEGIASAAYRIDGTQDDGTIWLVQRFDVLPGTAYVVELALDFWSPEESFNTRAAAAVYAGPRAPEGEADFDVSRPADVAAGWRPYAWDLQATSDAAGGLWVAFGITVLWETELLYHIDNVRIALHRKQG